MTKGQNQAKIQRVPRIAGHTNLLTGALCLCWTQSVGLSVNSKNTLWILRGSGLAIGRSKNTEESLQAGCFSAETQTERLISPVTEHGRSSDTPAGKLTFVSKVLFISGSKLLGQKWKKEKRKKKNLLSNSCLCLQKWIPTFWRLRVLF